jgi:hypothetical protein
VKKNRTATKWFGVVAAALTLTMVTSVSPAQAAESKGWSGTTSGTVEHEKKDTGWD